MRIYDKIFQAEETGVIRRKSSGGKTHAHTLVLLLLLIATVISVRITGFSRSIRFSHAEISSFVILGQMISAKDGIFKQYLGTAF